MKIEIWSDVMCPFCYIGKRNFETALNQLAEKNRIEVEWKSFQLNPSLPFEAPEKSYRDYLSETKGLSIQQVDSMLANVTNSAKQVGLDYNLDKAVMVNSFNAHKLIQYAKTVNKGDEAEERLFLAFFTEGKNIADIEELKSLGKEIGLDSAGIDKVFSDDKYAYLVKQDIQEARNLGVSGVPFFVLDRKYAVSGAQPPASFTKALERAFSEWKKVNADVKLDISEGQSCSVDGVCE